MHKSHNRANTNSLWTDIETFQWVLDQIYTPYYYHHHGERSFCKGYQCFHLGSFVR